MICLMKFNEFYEYLYNNNNNNDDLIKYYKILRNFKINKYSHYIELIYYDKSDQ